MQTLQERNHQVEVVDLYGEEFQPSLTGTERKSYHTESYDTSLVTKQIEQLKKAEALVLVFPTWWFGFPAMLKGWFDRVWVPGVAFDQPTDFRPIKPRLDKLRRTLVITTLGVPWWVDKIIMQQPVKKIVKSALLGACARKSKLDFLSLYNSDKVNGSDIQRFSEKIQQTLHTWERS